MLLFQNKRQQKEFHAKNKTVITILKFKNWLDKKKQTSDSVVKSTRGGNWNQKGKKYITPL